MLHSLARWRLTLILLVLGVSPAAGQQVPDWDTKQFSFEQIDKDRVRLMREVEVNGTGPNQGHQLFADELLWNTTTGELEAVGNVTVVSPTARLSAERVVFNTKTKLGTFYAASGLAELGGRVSNEEKSMFGTLEPDIYFYGQTIEKVGDDRYVISKGAFTTCVQPTPRWEIVSTGTTINLEDYAFLRNAVIRVKDVPVFYLPVLYYPIQSDDRATGFLLPAYGRSTVRGQSISNAFFWAINRSQDLTFLHDWYTKTGQGAGAEYRYVAAPGAEGFFRAYWLKEDESTINNASGGSVTSPAARSYELRGETAQPLPGRLRARARVNYFSRLSTQQLYHTNIYEMTNRTRSIAGSVNGGWAGVSVTGNFRRDEIFNTETSSNLNGYAPSVSANLSSKRLGLSPFYVAFNSEAARVLYVNRSEDSSGLELEDDRSLGRVDVSPTLRATISTLPYLSVNGTVVYRHTYLTESLDEDDQQIDVPVTRRYFDFKADIVGPVFSRVFNPNNGFADRIKHVIEPNVSFQRTTAYGTEDRIPQTAGVYDVVVGGVTRVNYGLTNRLLLRKAPADPKAPSSAGAPREFLNASITQTYYTDPRASQFDTNYQSGYNDGTPSSFSPVALTVRTNPTGFSTGTVRLEYDATKGILEGFNATGSTTYKSAQTSVGWSRRRFSEDFNQHSLNAQTTLNFQQGRTGGSYFMDWDIANKTLIQQRWVGFYNAQCCGFIVEYQQRNFPEFSGFRYPQDRRFNISFTLAGVGTFSNFFGVFGGSTY
jgi:hypothetical protein